MKMSSKKFCSILCDPKYQQPNHTTSYSEDINISDGSAESDQENVAHNLTIEWSDEDTGAQLSASFQTSTARKHTPLTASNKCAKRRRLPKSLDNIKVRRKLHNEQLDITCDVLQPRSWNVCNISNAHSLNALQTSADNTGYVDFDDCFIECPSSGDETWIAATTQTERIEQHTTTTTQTVEELDLLLDLIHKELCNTNTRTKKKKKPLRCRSGGLLQDLQKTLANAKADRRFLEHDKKVGLQKGTTFKVTDIQASFGVHMANLLNENKQLQIRAILPAELVENVKIGSELETYFDEDIMPYKLSNPSDNTAATEYLYVQPNKLLLL